MMIEQLWQHCSLLVKVKVSKLSRVGVVTYGTVSSVEQHVTISRRIEHRSSSYDSELNYDINKY